MTFTKRFLSILCLIIVFSLPVESNATPSLQVLRTHGVVQELDDYYSLGEVRLLTTSKLSRRNAYMASESEALDRLLKYVRFSKVEIPPSLVPLKGRLEDTLEKIYPRPNFKLRGMQLIHQNNDDQVAWSIIKVPRKSLAQVQTIKGNVDELIFRYVRSDNIRLSPELFYECLSLNHKEYADDTIIRLIYAAPNFKNVTNILKGDDLEQVPILWWSEKNNFTDYDLRGLGDSQLLDLLNAGLLLKWCHTDLYEEYARRGYGRFSERLKELFLNKPVNRDSQILTHLIEVVASHPIKYPELPGFSFFKQLLKIERFLPIEDRGSPADQNWEKAKQLIVQDKPNYPKVYSYCMRSLLEAPSADAFNLMGLSLQLMEEPIIALLCYGQALQIDHKHPKAATNIAILASELGEVDFSQTMALFALQNPKISQQAKIDLIEAGFKIEKSI